MRERKKAVGEKMDAAKNAHTMIQDLLHARNRPVTREVVASARHCVQSHKMKRKKTREIKQTNKSNGNSNTINKQTSEPTNTHTNKRTYIHARSVNGREMNAPQIQMNQ